MTELDNFFTGDPASWLDTLPEYQRTTLVELVSNGKSYDEVAEAWLAASVADFTYGFGTSSGPKVFFNKVLDEVHDLLCTGRGYQEERKTVLSDIKKGQAVAVGTVTEAIAPHVGSYAAFLSVAVVCIFVSITKIGKNAWCAMQTERRHNADSPGAS